MDGNQKSQPTDDSSHSNPQNRADNPPSLSEPTARQRPLADLPPAAAAVEQPATVEPSGGFFHADSDDGGDDSIAGYNGSDMIATPATPQSSANMVSWTSSGEDLQGYSASWRTKLSLGGIVVGGLIYLLTRDVFPSVAIAVAGVVFGFLGSRMPPAISYQIDQYGITVGQKRYSYNDFRSFSVPEEGMPTVVLAPLRRFLPMLAIRLDTQQTDDIVGLLAQHLPMEVHKRDALDKLVGKIKI